MELLPSQSARRRHTANRCFSVALGELRYAGPVMYHGCRLCMKNRPRKATSLGNPGSTVFECGMAGEAGKG